MTPHLYVRRWGARFGGAALPCSVGRGGISALKREGDGATPVGAHRLTEIWYRADRVARPRFCGPVRAIGPRDAWCEEGDDPRYNRAVLLRDPFVTERLRRGDPLYDLIGVLDWNAHGAAGLGSAIFLHRWRGPRRATAGCVALAPDALRAVIEAWTPLSRVIVRR